MSLPDGASMKRITTARVREYALLPVTAGRAVALATVPTMMFCLSPLSRALADDYFDPAALEFADPQQQTSDLHYFAKPGGQQPGTYPVTVVVNDQELGQADITFVDDGGQLRPVLTPGQLAEYGVNVSAFPAFQALHEGETFTRIEKFIPDASSRFSFANQRLTLSIPQAAMNVQSRGYVDPSRWDDGVPAAFVDYYFSGAQIKNADEGESSRSNYLNLRSGLNLGAWRLRNISSMQYDQQRRHWDTQSTWLQRDVRSLKSLLRIGDTYTTGDVFDSIQFRGVQLMSDDEMLPDSQRGFAPTIRGVAHSNAKVTVSQHGYVIYETFVSPGAFAISDLYPTSQSGDLEVKVTESNGAVRTFTQPYSAVPYMLREGRGKFSLSAGRYHSGGESVRSPEFLQGTLFYGLTAGFTLYGGTQLARDYQAWALGLGRGFGEFGSLGRGCHPGRHPYAVGQALYGPFAARSVSEKFCQLGHCVQPRQLSLLVKRLLRFCRSQRPRKRPGASRQPASPGRAVGVAKPWWPGQSGGFRLVAGVLASAESG
ncbi:type 1 fimbriae anchoring protein FimD [Klebsiella pneumoniae]|uniref:Type 1 fimbriae anchoring protein FimD n=1 Tax=Klebsiella pneumoniae TaxID=573 RepID=A0A447RNW7_KLEPN|nr:type 1 fimbriae anchoring protein FimD [Klebsiella pneumoniae]